MLGDREKFLKKYAVPEELFEQAGMEWEELCAIAEDYAYRVDGFYMIRDMFLKELIENREEQTGLHSYRTRIKMPGHLVEKMPQMRRSSAAGWKTGKNIRI